MSEPATFSVGQVWRCGVNRWRVRHVLPDGRAVLGSMSDLWAATNPLTMDEWNGDGRWTLETSP